MIWTETRTQKLIEYYDQGLSYSLIAARIGGITRNAVIGKLHRMKCVKGKPTEHLPLGRQRGATKNRRYMKQPRRVPIVSKPHWNIPQIPIPPPQVEDVRRVSFANLDVHHCRYPIGHPEEPTVGFCGLPKTPGRSYCAGHLHRCTTSVTVTGQLPRMTERLAIKRPRHVSKMSCSQPEKKIGR